MTVQSGARSCNWSFTVNNYTTNQIDAIKEITCRYIIFGKEKGEQGTPHLQGYVSFVYQKTLSAVRTCFPAGVHFEKSGGTAAQNITYCSKENDIWTKGTPPRSPKEKGELGAAVYKAAWSSAKEGRLEDIPEGLRLRYYNTFKSIARDYPLRLEPLPYLPGIWYCGPAGCGKSRLARDEYPDAYIKKADTKWWDGYRNENYVIIDDFDPFMISQSYNLKIWGDRYPFPAETKGGQLLIRPKVVVVTSQYHPNRIWQDAETIAAIERRYTIVCMV